MMLIYVYVLIKEITELFDDIEKHRQKILLTFHAFNKKEIKSA